MLAASLDSRTLPYLPALAVASLLLPSQVASAAQQGEDTPEGDAARAAAEPVAPSSHITGFRDVEWGTAPADLVATFGEPVERRVLDNGLRILAYRDSLAGRSSVLLLGWLEGRGLVKVQEVIDVRGGDTCIETIRRVHRQIDLQYPLIRPAEQAKNNTPNTVCDAAPRGLAFWHRQWRDDTTGSTITVSLASGSSSVDLIYESRQFREWTDPDGEAAVDVFEDEGADDDVLRARP